MPYPNTPGKHRGEAVVTPARVREWADLDFEAATNLVLLYDDDLLAYVRETYDGEPYDAPFADCYRLADHDVAVALVDGIGAPTTALVLDDHLEAGARNAVVVGHAGSLQPDLRVGDLVLVERALRDEGTSHHYVEPAASIAAASGLRARLAEALRWADRDYAAGATWTIDAIYRETREEVAQYRDDGVLTVDMEAAAVFAVAQHRGCEAAALFAVSDHLDPDGWDPHFEKTDEHLAEAFDIALDGLTR